MKHRSLAWVVVVVAVTSCSTATKTEEPSVVEPASEALVLPDLTEMLVVRSGGRFGQGDTVRVDLSSVSQDNQVTYYADDGASGSIAYDVLGPAGDGTMVVTAEQLNVRRCRSTGCSVVGQVARGREVRVHDFAGRWYEYAGDGGMAGYLRVDDLMLPGALENKLLIEIRERIADYYDGELKGQVVDGASIIDGCDVKRGDEMLSFEFYTPFSDGPVLQAPSEYFPAYSAGVYFDAPDTPTSDDVMVAGLSGGGGVYCMSPD
ncbi:MAG: SH3 domain-containing protein [Gemmatimonadales bacterium]